MKMLRPLWDSCLPVFVGTKCFIVLEFCTAKNVVILQRHRYAREKCFPFHLLFCTSIH